MPELKPFVDVFVTLPRAELRKNAEEISNQLREKGLCVITPLEVGGFGAQLKQASKHKAAFAVLLGDAELKDGKVVVKDMAKGEQVTVELGKVAEYVKSKIAAV
ncbi:MAG: hypothetical protein A3K03_11465 [Bdellovibrionales bacterium RIFOXYD1_FULL_44_7]|nr:MAG: hypothetical protein A3K03_11465 [Bdellovibrionales bacterium RIFOXYD1_FULL_44_7]